MKAVKLHPQKALCQERPESVEAQLPKLGGREKESKGGAEADRLVLKADHQTQSQEASLPGVSMVEGCFTSCA